MPEPSSPRPRAPDDRAPSLAGSRVTLLSLTAEGVALSGRNVPEGLSLDAFAGCLAAHRLSAISGRTFGDLVRTIARTGETARERCEEIEGIITARYDTDLWRQPDGSVGVMLVDITGRDHDADRVRPLSLELAHRTKNVLAVVLSLAGQTARRTPDFEHFKNRFFDQIQALSNAHDIIAATGWQGGRVGDIVDACIDTRGTRVSVTVAPPVERVVLESNAVQSIALILSELQVASEFSDTATCTIAETPAGALDLHWSCTGRYDRDSLWTAMLCRHAPASLEGEGQVDFGDDGFSYRLSIGAGRRI